MASKISQECHEILNNIRYVIFCERSFSYICFQNSILFLAKKKMRFQLEIVAYCYLFNNHQTFLWSGNNKRRECVKAVFKKNKGTLSLRFVCLLLLFDSTNRKNNFWNITIKKLILIQWNSKIDMEMCSTGIVIINSFQWWCVISFQWCLWKVENCV